MAMSKQDYIDLGRADALSNPPARRLFGKTGAATYSWQENAYDQGYNAVLEEQAIARAAAVAAPAAIAIDPLAGAPAPVIEHIGILRAIQHTDTTARGIRAGAKALALTEKWARICAA